MSYVVAGDQRSGAAFDQGRIYRYRLWRIWSESRPLVAFVGLNPSTADETILDPTVRRCVGFAKRWGYGGLLMGNIFALRSTDPKELYRRVDPVGPMNDGALFEIGTSVELVIAAWGTHGSYLDRGKQAARLLPNLKALGVTKEGHPVHPLYQPNDATPRAFSYAGGLA